MPERREEELHLGADSDRGILLKPAAISVLLFLLLVRLPAILPAVNLSPDATEYIDAARNFASGEGLILKIRGYFFSDGYGIPYPAQSLRSPLFPILMGSLYAILPSSAVFQIFNLAIFLANMILLTLILLHSFPARIAIFSLLLTGMTEPMFLTSIFPWAEQTAFFWLLLSILMAIWKIHVRWGIRGALLEGLVAACASLSRPEYILVGVLLFVWLLAKSDRRWPALLAYLAGFLVPLATVAAVNLYLYGRTFLPGDYLFRTRNWAAGPEGIGKMKTTFVLMPENWPWMLGRILRNVVNYTAKLMGWKNLFLMLIAVPAVLRQTYLGAYDQGKQLLALVSISFFVSYCLVFGGMDRERYLIAVTTFLLPLCLIEIDRWRRETRKIWVRRGCWFILFANLPLFLGNIAWSAATIHERPPLGERFYAKFNPAWINPDIQDLAAWVRSNVGDREVVGAENPFLINYLTSRCTLILPARVDPGVFIRLLRDYRVRYWIDNTSFTNRSPEQIASLNLALRQAGAQPVAQRGSYQVFRIP